MRSRGGLKRAAAIAAGMAGCFAIATSAFGDGLSNENLVQQMAPGINLGNTLEALNLSVPAPAKTSQETAWGNPPANQAIFDAYKAAGFKSVRIPVSWSEYADADGNIDPRWMARVKEVVDYARKSGLYVMINIHWDGGWMNHATYPQQAVINAKITKLWTQIANSFQGYDDHLLFAGINEVGEDNTQGVPTAEFCAVQNGFNQAFVKAVRATGGNNATRFLVVQSYFTNIDHALVCNATLPVDTAQNRLAMEVHYYDPYDFTINNKSTVWQWGANAADPSKTVNETWANESYTDTQFQKMKTAFADKGVPVIVGEYGAYMKTDDKGRIVYPGMRAYLKDWTQYVTKSIYSHGLVPMWWDTGALFDRTSGTQKDPAAIGWVVDSSK